MDDKSIMYGVTTEDETEDNYVKKNDVIISSSSKTKVIQVEGVNIEIINPEYVYQLERALEQSTKEAKNAARKVNRLTRSLGNVTSDIQQLKRDLGNKQDKYRG